MFTYAFPPIFYFIIFISIFKPVLQTFILQFHYVIFIHI